MRVRALGRSAAVFVVTLGACGGPRPPSRHIQFESTSHSARLANGMRVLVVEDHATNLVQLGVRLDVGSASDPIGKAGLAHLVEHLMFQIGEDRPIGAELSAVAIGFNAHTTWEATQYVTMARADQLERLLALEARRFAASCKSISPGTFEREREVVRNERRLQGGPSGGDVELLMREIYPAGHPYVRSVAGSDLELSRLTLADACGFIAAHYRPDRMVVVLSGDIEARRAISMVRRNLGRLRSRSRPARSAGRVPDYPALVAAHRSARGAVMGDSPVVAVAWPMPPAFSHERAASAIATSLLHSELTQEQGPGGLMMELGEARAPV
ncbi:MAG TPA: pitrilysin family protein, partial [Kofleriaceae bacterium]|nr:pitrilysin family protein [Kofleriaceae bacterium]